MSVVSSTTKHAVRIVALPLATHYPNSRGLKECLTYYHFHTPPPSEAALQSWTARVQHKAAGLWANLGSAPEGAWKRRAFLYGERLIDRVDFEELALKSFDTSLGPNPIGWKNSLGSADIPVIPLIYPTCAPIAPVSQLRALVETRAPLHKRGVILWTAATPLTAPLKLIPVIPNFPFFFCVWRAWSHYRALKASNYLKSFLSRGAIVPQPSAELDAIYARYAPSPALGSDTSSAASENGHPHFLLTRAAVPALEEFVGQSQGGTFAADVYRALEQVRLRTGGRA